MMNNKMILLLFAIIPFQGIRAQSTPKIKAIVEKEVKAYRQKIEKNEDFTALMKAFSIDTFRIEHTFLAKTADLVSSRAILEAVAQATTEYDVLLNQYYHQLLAKLKGDDKKTFIKAQKAWILFRDAEQDAIAMISEAHYSGGGSIQKEMNETSYQTLIKMRLLNIVHLLDRIAE